jgi:signal transduction histidine kinase/response regulator RpfG family c-di-GMP phosphodiesterase
MGKAASQKIRTLEERVLFMAPTRRDAEITQQLLEKAKLSCLFIASPAQLAEELQTGVGVLLLTDHCVLQPNISSLVEALQVQPEWSDVPIVLLAKPELVEDLRALLHPLSNITFVERPAAAVSIVSALEAAVRSRRRQYQVRDKVNELAQAAEQFEVMANSIPQLALMTTPEGKVFWYNRRWIEYTGSPEVPPKDWTWSHLTSPETIAKVEPVWKACIESGENFEMEVPLKGVDGNFRTFLSIAVALRDEESHIVKWLCTLTDVEEQRRLLAVRESLLESERRARTEAERAARMKDEFLATLSHELRTPLSSILGWAYLLKKSPANESLAIDASEVISRSGENLKSLVDDLLDLSRIVSGKVQLEFSPVNLTELVRSQLESFRPMAQSKDVVLDWSLDEAGSIMGDEKRLNQIISNLLSNAVRFTPAKGWIYVTLKFEGDFAVLSVADSGQGIDPDFLPRLFDRFTQADSSAARKHGGMGIGLSLVKQFTELHGGSTQVISEGMGKGSVFTVSLPIMQKARKSLASAKLAEAQSPITGLSILVVDDDQGIRDLLDRILTEGGAKVTTVSSADEALKQLEQELPSVIISDIGMPGVDGYEFMKEVRKRGIVVPSVALTAFVLDEDRDKAFQSGFQEYLPKPVQLNTVIDVVAELASRAIANATQSP